jgi:RNA polymerase sigma factor (sigma-70 family)
VGRVDDASAPLAPWPDDEFVDFAQARQHALLRAAFLVSGDLRLAEQVVLDALVQLARHWSRVREEQPDLFLRRLVYRDAVASWRRRAPVGAEGVPPVATDPEEAWGDEDAERRAEVVHALDSLEPRQRAVVVLRWFEERSEGEAAQVLGCSASAVRDDAGSAVLRLRAALPRVDLDTGGVR